MRTQHLAPLLAAALLSACASVAPGAGAGEVDPRDPYERLNRKVFAFNDQLDQRLLKPVATAYQKAVPEPVRESVTNFFSNLGDAWSALNWLVQGEVNKATEQGARFAWNSTLGVAGLFDVSTAFGLDKRGQDFGQTLGAWGVGTGPYLVLPVLGPSNLRDTLALPVDSMGGTSAWFDASRTQIVLRSLEIVNLRADLLRASELVEGIALDKYTFLRDASLQRRSPKKKAAAEEDDFEVAPAPTPAPAPAPKP